MEKMPDFQSPLVAITTIAPHGLLLVKRCSGQSFPCHVPLFGPQASPQGPLLKFPKLEPLETTLFRSL